MTFLQKLLLFGCFALCFFFLADAAINAWNKRAFIGKKRVNKRLENQKTVSRISQNIKRTEGGDEDIFIERYLQKLLADADSPMPVKNFFMVIAAIIFSLSVLFYLYIPYVPFIIGLTVSLFLGFGGPVMLLKGQVQNRNFRFEEQFPDALELIVRSLRIGQPLNASIKIVADEMPEPIGKEFFLASQEITYGKDLPDAMADMLKRVAVPDLRFFVVAVQIQHESGGNLAEILEGLSKIIRGRSRLTRKMKALTVEGRFSAWFLSLFPVFMIFVMNAINPGYYQKVANFPYFNYLVAATLAMLLMNVIAMQIMTKLKV
jgi:tight adherence protein B